MRIEPVSSAHAPPPALAVWVLPLGMRLADLVALALGGSSLSGSLASGLKEAIVNWDGHWYLGIAAAGYSFVPGTDSNVAFFPAFPLAMRYLGEAAGIGYPWAGVAISMIASVALSPLIYRLTALRAGRDAGVRAAIALAVFPTAFFFVLPYPEAAFSAAVMAAFYFASTDRWFLASFAAFAASSLKIFGVLLALSFAWIALERAGWSPGELRKRIPMNAAAAAAAAVGGAGVYSLYLWARFGRPFAYYSAQMDGWPHRRTPIVEPVLRTAGELLRPGSYIRGTRPDLYWAYLLDVTAVLVSVLVLVVAAKHLEESWIVFWIAAATVALLSGTTNSFARYELAVFPFFAGVGILLRKKALGAPLFVASGASQLLFAYLFGRGWWVG